MNTTKMRQHRRLVWGRAGEGGGGGWGREMYRSVGFL